MGPVRKTLKRRFPRLARLAIRVLSPVHALLFLVQYKPDRRILEDVVFPAVLADDEHRRVLFVGCAWYTRNYERHFRGREFWTIDVAPDMRRHGATRHVVGSMTTLTDHFAPESLDVVICNGVLGWGLNTLDDCEAAFGACATCLRPRGLLVLGWDDVDHARPVPFDTIPSLRSFEPFALPPFPSPRYPTFSAMHHTFGFFRRRDDRC